MERIKVSEEERERRKALKLPVTKQLRYMRRDENGAYTAFRVVDYDAVRVFSPSSTPVLRLVLDTGETVNIMADYFSQMQESSFVDDMTQSGA